MVTIPARQARAFRVIDNRTSELTSWDTDLLPDALSGLSDLDIFSFDDVLTSTATAGKTDPDDIPETPKNPVTRTGNLWVLGKHRIVCGDSTDQKTVERLLDGAEPDPATVRRHARLDAGGAHGGRAPPALRRGVGFDAPAVARIAASPSARAVLRCAPVLRVTPQASCGSEARYGGAARTARPPEA